MEITTADNNKPESFVKEMEKELEMQFTPSQINAIEDDLEDNLKVDAGAGSGKTTTITAMGAAQLDRGIRPSEIGYVTFTNKAAADLKSKVTKVTGKLFPEMKGLDEIMVATFHSFAFELLGEYIPHYKNFQLFNDASMRVFIHKYGFEIGLKLITKVRQESEPKQSKCTKGAFMGLMNMMQESELRKEFIPGYIMEAYHMYQSCLKKRLVMDFGGVLKAFYEELTSNWEFQEAIRNRFKVIFVDEYQDVNYLQESILRRLTELGIRLVVVGDGNQNIYSWRGSDNAYIERFTTNYHGKRYILGENFRSSHGIVELSKDIIRRNLTNLPEQEQKETLEFLNRIESESEIPFEMGDITFNFFHKDEEEAEFIANVSKKLLARGIPPHKIAVLLRKKKFSTMLIRKMREKQILVEVGDISNLFAAPEIQAVLHTFYYLNEEVSKEFLFRKWNEIGITIEYSRLKEGIDYLDHNKRDAIDLDYRLQTVYQNFLKFLGFEDHEGVRNPALTSIVYNLTKFSTVIDDFEKVYLLNGGLTNIRDFCFFIKNEVETTYQEGADQFQQSSPNSILITTVHKAKGLEFHAVFVPMLKKDEFPSLKDHFQKPWHILTDERAVVHYSRYHSHIESERRLLYVAVTRAEKFLFMSGCRSYAQSVSEMSEFGQFVANHDLVKEYTSVIDSKLDRYEYEGNHGSEPERIVVNVTALGDMYRCHYLAELSQKMGLVQPINRNMGGGESYHSAIHELHALMLTHKPINRTITDDVINRHIHLPYHRRTSIPYRRLVKNYQQALWYYYQFAKDRYSVIAAIEKPIETLLGDYILLKGRIDLRTRRNINGQTETYLTDLKNKKRIEDIEPHEREAYKEQLYSYAYLLERCYGEKVNSIEVLNSNKDGVTRFINEMVDPVRLQQVGDKIESTIRKIQQGTVSKETSKEKCLSCTHNYICLSRERKQEYGLKPLFEMND